MERASAESEEDSRNKFKCSLRGIRRMKRTESTKKTVKDSQNTEWRVDALDVASSTEWSKSAAVPLHHVLPASASIEAVTIDPVVKKETKNNALEDFKKEDVYDEALSQLDLYSIEDRYKVEKEAGTDQDSFDNEEWFLKVISEMDY